MRTVDPSVVQSLIEEIAATEIMPRFCRLEGHDIEMKGVDDPVTVADKAAETLLTRRLKELLPGSEVVGEECCHSDPSILTHFSGDGAVWVIDPVDGTHNFIAGRREFGVMVALVRDKQTVASWIHDPNTGHTLSAELGSGAWLAGEKVRLAGHDPSVRRLLLLGSRIRNILAKPDVAPLIACLPALAIGSAVAFDYARLFSGETLFANSKAPRATALLYRTAKPWDHVPGLLLHSEAGGYAADLSGLPYNREKGRRGLLVAADEAVWNELYAVIKQVIRELIRADS
ncbi:MAG: inositol monophosphatase [Alphaproteobacteria bacterium]|nr:inositol monophosphatase [Alphaproteobacteria bacterium]